MLCGGGDCPGDPDDRKVGRVFVGKVNARLHALGEPATGMAGGLWVTVKAGRHALNAEFSAFEAVLPAKIS